MAVIGDDEKDDNNYLIQEIEQLADVVCDGRRVWIAALEMLFVNFAHAFHALVDTFVIGICACFWPSARLNQQNGVRHVCCEINEIIVQNRWRKTTPWWQWLKWSSINSLECETNENNEKSRTKSVLLLRLHLCTSEAFDSLLNITEHCLQMADVAAV